MLFSRILPVVIVVVVFASLVATTHLVDDVNVCSCWCFPHIGNVIPFSLGGDLVSGSLGVYSLGGDLVSGRTKYSLEFFYSIMGLYHVADSTIS